MPMRYADCHSDRKHYGKGKCKPCYDVYYRKLNPGYHKQTYQDWVARHPEGELTKHVRRAYGISLDEYKAILSKGCAICGTMERLGLDHNHITNVNREALCWRHNIALGKCNDDPEELRALAEYLERHEITSKIREISRVA